MISFRKIAQVVWSAGLVTAIAMTLNLGFAHDAAWAAPSTHAASTDIAWGFSNNAEATAKDVEGKVQESLGNVSGDPKDQIMGKAKQAEGQVRNAAEDVKTSIKDNVGLEGRAKAVQKNVEGKLQETTGHVTDTPADQAMGKAKQAESQVRNAAEDVKSAAQDLFN
ncbi:CsbD family protein [Sodalinema gerasimenkoae]|uniref:CsbD family protein n=1 Tax=Sodalinema gerasimenkoae TaxID=2862348 RepID=UPI00135C3E28